MKGLMNGDFPPSIDEWALGLRELRAAEHAGELALEERASKLPATDPLTVRLKAASAAVDELRKKIVATKEGGAITGEERLRENLADLYGNVVGYEGRPSATQVARADVLSRELADVEKDFDAWLTKELPAINSELTRKRLEPIKPLTRADWDATNAQK